LAKEQCLKSLVGMQRGAQRSSTCIADRVALDSHNLQTRIDSEHGTERCAARVANSIPAQTEMLQVQIGAQTVTQGIHIVDTIVGQ
jgi:hypothetical protein